MNKFWFFFLIVSTYEVAAENKYDYEKDGAKECLVVYLKTLNLIENSFPSETNGTDKNDCEKEIEGFLNELKTTTKKQLNDLERKDYSKFESCVIKVHDKYNILPLYLKGLAIHLHNKSSIGSWENETIKDDKLFLQLSLDICDPDRNIGNFDKISKLRAEVDYATKCQIKYLFQKEFINSTQYDVTLPPSDLKNCDRYIKEVDDKMDMGRLNGLNETSTIYGMRIPTAAHCIYRKLKNKDVNQNRMAVKVLLTNLSLNDAYKKPLREFYEIMETAATEIILECLTLALTIA